MFNAELLKGLLNDYILEESFKCAILLEEATWIKIISYNII